MHEVDDLGHGLLLAALGLGRVGELERLAIAQQAAGQQQVVEVGGRALQALGIHREAGGAHVGGRAAAAVVLEGLSRSARVL